MVFWNLDFSRNDGLLTPVVCMSYIVNTFRKQRNLLCFYIILENISIHLVSRGIYCHIYIKCSLNFRKTKIRTVSRDIVSHFGLRCQDSNLELLEHLTKQDFSDFTSELYLLILSGLDCEFCWSSFLDLIL